MEERDYWKSLGQYYYCKPGAPPSSVTDITDHDCSVGSQWCPDFGYHLDEKYICQQNICVCKNGI